MVNGEAGKIKLTKGLYAIVDNEDISRLQKYHWVASKTTYGKYRAEACIEGKSVRMHRYITNAPFGQDVHHIDSNPLNNKKDNLICCSHSAHFKMDGKHKPPHGSGEENSFAKFTNQQVYDIIKMYKTGLYTQQQIADIHGVHRGTIKNILLKRTYKNAWKK